LPTGSTNISGPRAAGSVVALLDGDPRDASGIVVVCDADICGLHSCRTLGDGEGDRIAIFQVFAIGLSDEFIECVEAVDGTDPATLCEREKVPSVLFVQVG
jgi:hypothetical protein